MWEVADHFTHLAKANPNKNQTARNTATKKIQPIYRSLWNSWTHLFLAFRKFWGILKFTWNTLLNFWNMKTWYHPRRIVVSVIWLLVLATFSAFDSAWFSFPELCHLIWTINKIISQIFFQRITTTLVCYLYLVVVLRQFIFSLLQDFSGVLNSTNFQVIVW